MNAPSAKCDLPGKPFLSYGKLSLVCIFTCTLESCVLSNLNCQVFNTQSAIKFSFMLTERLHDKVLEF